MRVPVTLLIEFFRAIPLLVVIFALYFVLPAFGPELSAFAALGLGLTLYNMAGWPRSSGPASCRSTRASARPRSRWAMRKTQVMTLVLLPQATRRMLPVLIAQIVVLLKDTSLGFIIGYFELLRQARSLVEFLNFNFGNIYTCRSTWAPASSTS